METSDEFEIKILDIHWLNMDDNTDNATDLCAHGHLFLKIGNKIISNKDTFDVTLSSAALHLLRTVESNYVYEKGNFESPLISHCGHFIVVEDGKESVVIMGCNQGVDWIVTHTSDTKIEHIFDDGYKVILDKDRYRRSVFGFADEVERFYDDSIPKVLTDEFTKKGYLAFWKEWRSLRDQK